MRTNLKVIIRKLLWVLREEDNVNTTELLLKIQELERRIEMLEQRKSAKGVVLAGSPSYVKDYMKQKREENKNG